MNSEQSLPPHENVLRTEHWRVAHAFDTGLPGWLVIVATRHIRSLAELSADSAAELGRLQWALSVALGTVVGCEKTYVMQFSEADGFSHLHVHVVPRMAGIAADLKGPRIFALLGVAGEKRILEQEMDRLAAEIGPLAADALG